MLGLVGEATVSRLPWPTYRAVLRFFRPAESALRRLIVVAARGLVVEPAVSRPKPAGAKRQGKGISALPSFQLFDPQTRIVLPRRRTSKRPGPRIHMFNADNELVTIWPPPRPAARLPLRRPNPLTAWSARRGSSAGSRLLRLRSLICRARPGGWRAGGCGRRHRPTPASNPRSGRAVRRATEGGPFTKSMNCSASATGWPVTLRCPTRAEAEIVSIRINLTAALFLLGPNAIGGEVARAKPVTERGRWPET